MGHGPCTFKKRDVEMAVRAARDAGVEVARVEIDKDGKIVIVIGKPEGSIAPDGVNEWDTAKWRS